jgi:hypothetical protein
MEVFGSCIALKLFLELIKKIVFKVLRGRMSKILNFIEHVKSS